MKIQLKDTMPSLRRSSSRRVKKSWLRSTPSTQVMTTSNTAVDTGDYVCLKSPTRYNQLWWWCVSRVLFSNLSWSSLQKSWLRPSGDSPRCRTSYSHHWMPRGRAPLMGGAWGGGRLCLLCLNRNDVNTETSRTCSWPSQSSTSASYCCRTIRYSIHTCTHTHS